MIKTLKASTLILDYTLYPRQHIDETNVRAIRAAIEAGETLPPVVADKKTLRVIDGFHRVTQALRADPDATINVELVDYPDESAMFLDAVTRNARHGARLTSYDVARVVTISEDWKITTEALAKALAVPLGRIEQVRISRTAFSHNGRKIQVKRPLRHLAGATLTEQQERANELSSGWDVTFHAKQIVLLLETGVADLDDPETVEALRVLAASLEKHLLQPAD